MVNADHNILLRDDEVISTILSYAIDNYEPNMKKNEKKLKFKPNLTNGHKRFVPRNWHCTFFLFLCFLNMTFLHSLIFGKFLFFQKSVTMVEERLLNWFGAVEHVPDSVIREITKVKKIDHHYEQIMVEIETTTEEHQLAKLLIKLQHLTDLKVQIVGSINDTFGEFYFTLTW